MAWSGVPHPTLQSESMIPGAAWGPSEVACQLKRPPSQEKRGRQGATLLLGVTGWLLKNILRSFQRELHNKMQKCSKLCHSDHTLSPVQCSPFQPLGPDKVPLSWVASHTFSGGENTKMPKTIYLSKQHVDPHILAGKLQGKAQGSALTTCCMRTMHVMLFTNMPKRGSCPCDDCKSHSGPCAWAQVWEMPITLHLHLWIGCSEAAQRRGSHSYYGWLLSNWGPASGQQLACLLQLCFYSPETKPWFSRWQSDVPQVHTTVHLPSFIQPHNFTGLWLLSTAFCFL